MDHEVGQRGHFLVFLAFGFFFYFLFVYVGFIIFLLILYFGGLLFFVYFLGDF